MITKRFVRMAPIRVPEGYFIYCQDKNNTRLTYEMCQARQVKKRCPSKSCQYYRKDLIYND